MTEKFSFYLEHDNNLFSSIVLAICYKADSKEIKEYGLTGENILILVKSKKLESLLEHKTIDYFSELKNIFSKKDIFLRIQSECLLGIYGDSHCDCETQRINSINIIKEKGGMFIHLPQEGQGWGLHYKLKELEVQVSGRLSTGEYIGEKNRDDAQKLLLGNNEFDDCRGYEIVVKILKFLGLYQENYVLITESEKKLSALREKQLKVIKFSDYKDSEINAENISEYLIKILNSTHEFDERVIDRIIEIIGERKYNGRALSTLVNIVDKINNNKLYNLNSKTKKKLLNVYDQISCGVEKRYIVDDTIIKLQNSFSCKVNSSVFKAIQNMYGKNIFDRISLEKLYYFESKTKNKSVRIRTSKVLDTMGKECIFLKGQIYVEQKTFSEEKSQIFQSEISLSKLRSFFENYEYDFVKRVEMITTISERQIPGINIYIKKLPNIESRIMDIYGKKENIQNFIKNIMNNSKRNVLNDVVSNSDYEDENFTNYNLRFADIETAIREETEIYELLTEGDDVVWNTK